MSAGQYSYTFGYTFKHRFLFLGSELYIARHFYEAEDDNQLSLETGRIVEVQEKLDNGWWRGVTGGKEGWFPATFVKKIDGIYDTYI